MDINKIIINHIHDNIPYKSDDNMMYLIKTDEAFFTVVVTKDIVIYSNTGNRYYEITPDTKDFIKRLAFKDTMSNNYEDNINDTLEQCKMVVTK